MVYMETKVIVTDASIDEIFIVMQPDEQSRQEAVEWIKNETLNNIQVSRPKDISS
jgi:hypothetical protein